MALQTTEAALTGESLPVSKSIAPIKGETVFGDPRQFRPLAARIEQTHHARKKPKGAKRHDVT